MDSCHEKLVHLRVDGHIAAVEMRTTNGLNFLSLPMLSALRNAFAAVKQDKNARCLVVRGGLRVFSAGADLNELLEMSAETGHSYAEEGQATLSMLRGLDIPSVAVVSGFALGGGCELSMSTTFRVATPNSTFGLPELGLGMMPGFGGTQLLTRLVGEQTALRLILTGSRINGREAHSLGIVDILAEESELDRLEKTFVQKLVTQPPDAVTRAMHAVRGGVHLEFSDALALEARHFGILFTSPNRQEGLRAFLEHRTPSFSRRATDD